MSTLQREVDERTSLTTSNKFELLLFRLGMDEHDHSELFGINVFKVREIVAMPVITAVAGAEPFNLGVVNLRGQIIPVIDLPAVVGIKPKSGLNIMLVTEYARTVQGFAVESVEEIVRLEWCHVLAPESSGGSGMVTSIVRIDGDAEDTRLAQVLDVEQILRKITAPDSDKKDIDPQTIGPPIVLKPGSIVLAADDSAVARGLIAETFAALGVPFIMTRSGKEAWDRINSISEAAKLEGKTVYDKIAVVMTDLEMPEMDGITLTRNIKQHVQFRGLPVIIHSSLSGSTNENHVRTVGADAYVAKFSAEELCATIREVLLEKGS